MNATFGNGGADPDHLRAQARAPRRRQGVADRLDQSATPFSCSGFPRSSEGCGTEPRNSRFSLDGETNWLEGIQLLALYLIAAVAFFFLPC